MNAALTAVIAASDRDRRDLFLATATRLGTNERNVEKDFWVCWTLDALFNGLPESAPRMLFKGGTSLSKGFGLIDRFSEDIDITVFRNDLGHPASIKELEALSGKKRKIQLDVIREACRSYVTGALQRELHSALTKALASAGADPNRTQLLPDQNDTDGQTLLLWFPSVTTEHDGYIRPAVKIESGARSALDPNVQVSIMPYVNDELAEMDLTVSNVTTVAPERTFWDKVVILHGLRRWFDHRGVVRQEGQRITRHYYDIYQLLQSDVGRAAEHDRPLAIDCARHARMFFNRPDLDLVDAVPGKLTLVPSDGMLNALRRDYLNMSGMIFGPIPEFDRIVEAVASLEERVNAVDIPAT